MAKYFLSNKAVEDLSYIWNYTYDFWSENQADKYYEGLIHACLKLAGNPKLGRSYDGIQKEILGYLVKYHIIFHMVLDHNKVEIVRILHSSMDLKNRIKG